MLSTCPHERLMIFLWKSYISFHHFLNINKKLFNFRPEKFGKLVQKAIWMSKGTFRGKKLFLDKKLYFPLHRFWTSGQVFPELWRQYSSTVVQTEFYFSMGGVRAKIYFWGNFFYYSFSEKIGRKNMRFVRKKQQGRQNYILGVQRSVLRKNNFSERVVFVIVFVHWPKKVSFLRKNFSGVVRIAFCLSRGTFWGKISF